MAIMKRCCCFSDTRSGSIASAVYSLLYSVGYIVVWTIQFLSLEVGDSTGGTENISRGGIENISTAAGYAIIAAYFIDIIVLGFLFIPSIILIIGVRKNIKGLLIPYMVAITVLIVFQAIAWSLQIFGWVSFNASLIPSFIASLCAWVVLAVLNVICLLCVISQYQELRDRGDEEGNVTTTRMNARPRVITSPTETTIASYPVPTPTALETEAYTGSDQPPPNDDSQSYVQSVV